MQKLLILTAFLSLVFGLNARQITDMAGRSLTIPDQLNRIMPYDAKTSILLFPCSENKLISRGMLPGKTDFKFISPGYAVLPETDIKNLEAVLAMHPDVVIAGCYLVEDNKEPLTDLQKKLNIPVILVDLSLNQLDKTYRFLGDLLGQPNECKMLADYISGLYNLLDPLTEKPLSGVEVYYALGNDGLMTDPSGSKHTGVFDFLKIPNAAKVEIPTGGHATVNMEQVILWNPGYIFTATLKGKSNAYQTITTSQTWAGIKAVKEGKVFQVPGEPFSWFDHPPTINRIPGIIWLSQIFYGLKPEKTKEEIVEFYKLFYNYQLNDEEYKRLFN
jgi:iron complex transport system substrate-binding protein